MPKQNIVEEKSYSLALEIVAVYKVLIEKKEFVLSKQLLRSGTSIGANVHEATVSESKKDFVHKLGIALKETHETMYWLRLLFESSFLDQANFNNLKQRCDELIKILNSIILTTKTRYLAVNSHS